MKGVGSMVKIPDVEDYLVAYRLFKEDMKRFKLVPVDGDRWVEVKPYQLRFLSSNIPDFWLLVSGERNDLGLYKVLVLTLGVCLAKFSDDVPLLWVGRLGVAACLPFCICLSEDFLRRYSFYVADVDEVVVRHMLEWVDRVRLPDKCSVHVMYIGEVLELMTHWYMGCVVEAVDKKVFGVLDNESKKSDLDKQNKN